MRQPLHQLLLVTTVLGTAAGVCGSSPSSARAYHTYKTRLLNTTAYSLDRREVRLGLMEFGYGIVDQLQISTFTMPWVLGAILEEVSPNLQLRSTFYNRNRLALSAQIAFIDGRAQEVVVNEDNPPTDPFDTRTINYLIVPIGAASSVRINPTISTHFGGLFTFTDVAGGSDPADSDIQGAAVINMLQLWGMFEWRLSRVTAFTLTVRWLPYVSDTVVKGSLEIDPNTGAIIEVDVEIVDLSNAFAVIPGFVFSWDRANLRIGVGYGDFFVESLGLVIPGSTLSNISPELDVYVRF